MRRRRRHRRHRHRRRRHRHRRHRRCCGVVGSISRMRILCHESRIPFFAYAVLSRYGQGAMSHRELHVKQGEIRIIIFIDLASM